MTSKKLILGMLLAFAITITLTSNTQIAYGALPTINSVTVNSNDSVDLICTDPLTVVTGRLVRIDNNANFLSNEVTIGGAGDLLSIVCDGITSNNISFLGNYNDFDVINLRLRIFDGSPAASSRTDTTFIVADNTNPIITPNPITDPFMLELTDSYIEGCTATDNDPTYIDNCSIQSGSIDTSISSLQTVTYEATDPSGNTETSIVTTTIIDNIVPVITLIGDAEIDVSYGSVYVDQGATALDVDDGDITGSIITINPVNTLQGLTTFVITYDVTDSSGNVATQVIRTINVGQAPSGNGCNNCQQPSIGIDNRGIRVVEDGITVNGITNNADFYHTDFPLIQADIGEEVTMQFVIWDDRNDNIAHVEVGLGKGKIGESFGKLESSMIWKRHVMTKIETITFDKTAFEDVKMTMEGKAPCTHSSTDQKCDLFRVQFTPVKAIVGDIVFGISIWDDNRNAMTSFFNHGLQIGTESDVIHEIEYVIPQGTGNRSYDTEDTYDNVMTRISPNFNLVKQYEMNRANEVMKSLFPELFAEEKHSETIKVYLSDSLNMDDSIDTTKNSQ